ncbi:hypothetical protein BU23DRAFT_557891 [Bimuria novae-zelandiae CBS 107.79]|uniref:Uncharacterized protein n=1 Tax=Bimuria novae-zelandiae CBS 107.79 TaxID=1447943 RepID=A0A6A5UW36_9PLEO|nr:hypothetical protein BU23DRAFT_557891 [Bimuria novae-zelandiae CBS 107.79]
MALVAHDRSFAAHGSLHQEKLVRYPRYYARLGRGQGRVNDEHNSQPFLYTGPRLQSACGSRKAKKVLGLVAQFERRSTEEDEQRGGPSKAQRTLGLVTDLPRDRRSWRKSGSGEFTGAMELKLAQVEENIRRLSRLQDMAIDSNDEEGQAADDEHSPNEEEHKDTTNEQYQHSSPDDEEASQPDPEKSTFLSLSLHDSPQQLSFPRAPIELDAGPDHELLLPPPRPRIRPHSYTSPRCRDRPTNKIASSRSRGLRANSSPPNFSRPLSGEAPTPIPGEEMERDPLSIRFCDIDADPRSPISPIGGTLVSNEIKAALEKLELGIHRSRCASPVPPPPAPATAQRRSKPRWSSLPVSLMKFATKKRASKSEEDGILIPRALERRETKEVGALTEENLQRWEDEVGYVPKMYRLGYDLLKSPVEADMLVERATPVPGSKRGSSPCPDKVARANAQGQMLTPPMSPPMSPPMMQMGFSSNGSTAGVLSPPATETPTLSKRSTTWAHSPGTAIRSSTTSALIRHFPDAPGHSHYQQPPLPQSYHHHRQSSLAAQKEALSLAASPGELLSCTLCGETEHPSSFPAQPLSAACAHAPRVCKECVKGHVQRCWAEGVTVRCLECGVSVE